MGRNVTMLLALAVLLAAGPVRAQEDPLARYQAAVELARSGRMAEALDIWLAVVDKLPAAQQGDTHKRIGLAYRKYGKLPEAWQHLNRYTALTDAPEAGVEKELAAVTKSLKRSHSRVEIATTPTGATLYIGKEATGTAFTTPLTWWFKPGRHDLHLVKTDYAPATVVLSVAEPGGTTMAAFTLHQDTRDGILEVKGPEVGAQVFLDGRLEGTVPFRRKIKPGTYEVMVGRPGLPVWKEKVTVVANQSVVRRPRLARESGDGSMLPSVTDAEAIELLPEKKEPTIEKIPVPWWKWTVAGAGVALVAAGTGLHVAAYQRNEDLRTMYPDGDYWHRAPAENPIRYQDGYDNEVVPMATAGYVLYAVGGVATVTGAVLLLLHEDEKPAPGSFVAPMAVEHGGGITFGTAF